MNESTHEAPYDENTPPASARNFTNIFETEKRKALKALEKEEKRDAKKRLISEANKNLLVDKCNASVMMSSPA
eukprot:CAMPEP_0172497136 /NCGR_PEP_ID=MMETSP1066-20121228/95732_1 /TAXON_ID=671091 /ORGANISM="Coscinodiscus wailesii, Strain CCMP2513" /LENGTH=72 /DNA_ID=CAMNT_0013269741 /DNA_START=90 /DNA_END=308 /DNA_ORIENTATION=-